MNPPPDRARDLEKVRTWFLPAFAPDEVLRAALAATPFPLTTLNSLIGTAKELVGQNQGRVLLLTDRAIHVVGRQFWRRRYRRSLASFPLGTTAVRRDAATLWIADVPYYITSTGPASSWVERWGQRRTSSSSSPPAPPPDLRRLPLCPSARSGT